MFPRRRIGKEFNRFFRQIEQEIEDIENEVDELMQRARKAGPREEGEPLIYGWSFHVGSEGEPHFERFGNVDLSKEGLAELSEGWRRPHTTWHVDDDADEFVFTAELPGVPKDEIDVEIVEPDVIHLRTTGSEQKYKTIVEVPHDLDASDVRASFNNGVLELRTGLANGREPERTKVEIE